MSIEDVTKTDRVSGAYLLLSLLFLSSASVVGPQFPGGMSSVNKSSDYAAGG